MNKDVHLLVRTLRRRGYGIERGGSGHLLVLSPAGKQVWTLPSSPSDHRWYTNTVRDLIRAGLIDEDPRGSGRRKPARGKRDTGGQSPPPLPDLSFPDRKDPVPSTSHQITVDLIDKSTLIFQTLQAQYDLQMRKGRLTPHGGVPILTEIMLAYEQETGKAIPNFNYNSVLSKYDANDRREMARLAANRISDILTKKVGAALSKVGQDSILYGERAMAWFEDRGFTFPNGQTLEVGGYHGVEVVRVDDGVGVEDEALAQEAMAEMGIGPGRVPDPARLRSGCDRRQVRRQPAAHDRRVPQRIRRPRTRPAGNRDRSQDRRRRTGSSRPLEKQTPTALTNQGGRRRFVRS